MNQNEEKPKHAVQVDSIRKRADFIYEDYHWMDMEKFYTAMECIGVITEEPGRTVQDAIDILEDAKAILLKYQFIC